LIVQSTFIEKFILKSLTQEVNFAAEVDGNHKWFVNLARNVGVRFQFIDVYDRITVDTDPDTDCEMVKFEQNLTPSLSSESLPDSSNTLQCCEFCANFQECDT